MATVAKLQENGSDVLDLNSGAFSVAEFLPNVPGLRADGNYDLVSDIQDEMALMVKAATLDAVANALGELDRRVYGASLVPGRVTSLVWKADTLTNSGAAIVKQGEVRREGRAEKTHDGQYLQMATLRLLREPVWRGTWTQITLDPSSPSMDNDDTAYIVLPELDGDMPAPARFIAQSSGGSTASNKRALAALKANSAANFSHILQVESANFLNGALTNQAQTYFSPGGAGTTAKRWTAADTNETQLGQWYFTSNLASWRGWYLPLLRLRENSASRNYRFRFRSGSIVNGVYVPGPWGTANYVRVPTTNSADTNEQLLIALGLVGVPAPFSNRDMPKDGIYFELYGKADSVTGSADLDNVFLMPVGECGSGFGLVAAEFDLAFSAGRPTFDSRADYPRAYLHDGTNFLVGAKRVEGGGIFLMPQVAGQRVYFLVMRDEAGNYKHDRTNTLAVTAHYQPIWVHMPGTN